MLVYPMPKCFPWITPSLKPTQTKPSEKESKQEKEFPNSEWTLLEYNNIVGASPNGNFGINW